MRPESANVLLTACAPLILVAMVCDAVVLEWLAALLIPALPVLLVAATGGPSVASRGLSLLWVLLAGSLLGLLWLTSVRDLSQPSAGEVTATLGLMLLGLGLAPLALVAWLYARSFSSRGLSPEELERLGRERDE